MTDYSPTLLDAVRDVLKASRGINALTIGSRRCRCAAAGSAKTTTVNTYHTITTYLTSNLVFLCTFSFELGAIQMDKKTDGQKGRHVLQTIW